ncbi:Hypothetical protein LUCI_2289 [Lucifera butyrica]|uniref:Uncharacterized protein n=1 Tax=Lucifera butyrica TaxID=1351585 RepID=A0A498R7U3_9FIRM|nr:hypothetical protein [Lucifera butyrica]VBB07045.1 Hypothetical protein LUCI_2289 [Lucifera butyrica]
MERQLSKRQKGFIIMLALLGVLSGAWFSFSAKAGKMLQDNLIRQISQHLNGRLQVGDIGLTVSGWIAVKDVALYDAGGNILLRVPILKLNYRWSDLTHGNVGLQSIESVRLEGAEIWLQEKNSRWNWEGLLKDSGKETTGYHGNLELADGKIHVATGLFNQLMENVSGSLGFQAYPDVAVNLQGKTGGKDLSISGHWGEERPGEMAIRLAELDLAPLAKSFTTEQAVHLTGGKLEQLTITAKRQTNGAITYRLDSSFSGLALDGKVKIREGSGKISSDGKKVQFTDLSLQIGGQQATGKGTVSWQNSNSSLEFSLALPDVDPAAFLNGLEIQRPLAIQLQVDGSLTQPRIRGSFSAPQFRMAGMAVDNISGSFRYNAPQLVLEEAHGELYQGTLAAAGTIDAETQNYELDVSGQNMESSRLTDKDVHGPLAFTGHTSGHSSDAVTKGTFTIQDGKAYGIAFRTMTGSFVKQGTATEISDLAVNTSLGTFYPEQLSKEAMERLKSRQVPTTRAELQQAVANKLVQSLFH